MDFSSLAGYDTYGTRTGFSAAGMDGRARMATRFAPSREVVELVADMLASRWRKSQIRTALEEVNGGQRVANSAVESCLRRARALILSRTRMTQEEHRAESVAFYEQVIRDESAPWRERIKAQERLDAVLGLEHKFRPIGEDPDQIVSEIQAAMRDMDSLVPVGEPLQQHNGHNGRAT